MQTKVHVKILLVFFTVYIWINKQMNQPQKYFGVHLPTEKGESVRNLVVKRYIIYVAWINCSKQHSKFILNLNDASQSFVHQWEISGVLAESKLTFDLHNETAIICFISFRFILLLETTTITMVNEFWAEPHAVRFRCHYY